MHGRSWVYFQRERDFARIEDDTIRRSAIFRMSNSHVGLRRSVSSSTLVPPGPCDDLASQGYKNLERLTRSGDLDLGLSTPDVFVSPKPLQPTHLLACHDTAPANGIYFRLVECPVNALLLLASCPNLDGGVRVPGSRGAGYMPSRMHRALPKVLLRVPDLDTIAPLVVYLHTRNQAELMRMVVPAQWIRDLLHPLPSAAPEEIDEGQDENRSLRDRIQGSPTKRKGRKLDRARSPFRQATNLFMNLNTSLTELVSHAAPPLTASRTAEAVAMEIAERCVADSLGLDLARALQQLGGLRQNMEVLGYFGRELWGEVQANWEILVKALNCTALFDARDETETE